MGQMLYAPTYDFMSELNKLDMANESAHLKEIIRKVSRSVENNQPDD
jgi:hypothetical protein